MALTAAHAVSRQSDDLRDTAADAVAHEFQRGHEAKHEHGREHERRLQIDHRAEDTTMTDEELNGAESPEWIAVYKPGLTQLVKDLTDARIKNSALTSEVDEQKTLLKLLRRRNQNGYR